MHGVLWRQVMVGVVYNPITDELFTAVLGEGSQLNNQQLRVSQETDLGSGLLITEIGVGRDHATVEAVFDRVANATQAARAIRVRRGLSVSGLVQQHAESCTEAP